MNEVDVAEAGVSLLKSSSLMVAVKKLSYIAVPSMCIMAACVIVMSLTNPKTSREIIVALIATFAGAMFGPSLVILLFEIDFSHVSLTDQDYARNLLTIVCGLPGWVFVRACFNWSEINKTKNIVDLIKQIKDLWK